MSYLTRRKDVIYYVKSMGRAKKLRISLRTKNVSVARVRKRQLDERYGNVTETSELRFSEVMTLYLEKTSTRRTAYSQKQDRFRVKALNTLIGHMPLHNLNPISVTDALSDLRKRGISQSTADHYLSLLRAIAHWCVERGYIHTDFTLGIKKTGKPASRDHVPRNRWNEFLSILDKSKYRLAAEVCLFTGLRRGELLGLEVRDFDLENKVLKLRPEIAKTKDVAYLPIAKHLIAPLRQHLASTKPTAAVFPFYAPALQRRIGKVLRQMGFASKLLGLHTLRHSFVTRAYEIYKPLEAQKLARHRSFSTTARYVHLSKLPVENGKIDAM